MWFVSCCGSLGGLPMVSMHTLFHHAGLKHVVQLCTPICCSLPTMFDVRSMPCCCCYFSKECFSFKGSGSTSMMIVYECSHPPENDAKSSQQRCHVFESGSALYCMALKSKALDTLWPVSPRSFSSVRRPWHVCVCVTLLFFQPKGSMQAYLFHY